jgi:hypothetical protein
MDGVNGFAKEERPYEETAPLYLVHKKERTRDKTVDLRDHSA